MPDFAATVSAWVAQSQERITAVFRESSQQVIEDMQTPVGAGGNLPILTGFLRASLQVTKDAPIGLTQTNPDPNAKYATTDVAALAIAGAEIGDILYAAYGAVYARSVNYGRNGSGGRLFVETAAQKWPSIVEEVSARAQSLTEG